MVNLGLYSIKLSMSGFSSYDLIQCQAETIDIVFIGIGLYVNISVGLKLFEYGGEVVEAAGNIFYVIYVGAETEVYKLALKAPAGPDKVLWLDVAMNDIVVLKEGEKSNELEGEVDDLLNRKLLVLVFNNFV